MSAGGFDGQVVLVTGAAGHLGKAVASRFAGLGAQLVLLDRRVDRFDTPRVAPKAPVALAADLLDEDALRAVLAPVLDRVGRLDVVCHLAGGFRMGEAVHETTAETWDFLLDLNARSFVNLARVTVPRLLAQRAGRVVTVGAFAARQGVAQMGAYTASKSALIRLTEAMSAELKEHGINVNCVLPTIIDTPDNRAAMPDADPDRWVAPTALAEVITFLASDAARAVHGAALPVTGLS